MSLGYINKHLFEGEQIIYEGRFHWVDKIRPWLFLILLGIIVIGIFMFIVDLVRIQTTEFAVTSRRVVMKTGFLRARVIEITLDSIEGSRIKQGPLGRIFGFGELELEGRGDSVISFPRMAKPDVFRAQIEIARQASHNSPKGEA